VIGSIKSGWGMSWGLEGGRFERLTPCAQADSGNSAKMPVFNYFRFNGIIAALVNGAIFDGI